MGLQLNKEVGSLYTDEQGGRVILSWEAGSVGEQSLGNKHPGKENYGGHFLYTLSIPVPGEAFVITL